MSSPVAVDKLLSSPAVTICMPTYNGARFIAQAIQSAQAQTLQDWELLIVDDGSSDETLAIAGQFQASDSRIHIHVNPENLGLPANWDRARQLARGEWVCFLFQDDLFHPSYLACMLQAASAHGASLVCCRREFHFDPEVSNEVRQNFLSYVEKHNFAQRFPEQKHVAAVEFSAALAATPCVNFIGEPTAVMLHKSALATFGPFHPVMRQLVDFEYWARIGVAKGIAYVDDQLVTFRVHASSATSANARNVFRKDRLDGIILLHEFLHARAYASLRDPMKNRARLLRHYVLRVAELKRGDDSRAPGDPSWNQAVAYFPALRHPGLMIRLATMGFRFLQWSRDRSLSNAPKEAAL